MEALNYSATLSLFKEYVKEWNDYVAIYSITTRERVRNLTGELCKQHIQLFRALMKQYGDHFIYKRNLGHTIEIGDEVSTNNVRLAKLMDCDKSTIYRLVQRLLLSGVLVGKTSKGSVNNYVVRLNMACVKLGAYFNSQENERQLEELKSEQLKALTLEGIAICNPRGKREILNKELKGVESGGKVNNAPIGSVAASNQLNPTNVGNEDKKNGDAESKPDFAIKKPDNVAVTQPLDGEKEKLFSRGGDEEAGKHAQLSAGGEIETSSPVALDNYDDVDLAYRHALVLWELAFKKLFARYEYLTDSQRVAGLTYFMQQFENKGVETYKTVSNKLAERINYAAWYSSKRGFVIPLPASYFNENNWFGFVRTKKILDDKQRKLYEFRQWRAKQVENDHIFNLIRQAAMDYSHTPTLSTYIADFSKLESTNPLLASYYSMVVTELNKCA